MATKSYISAPERDTIACAVIAVSKLQQWDDNCGDGFGKMERKWLRMLAAFAHKWMVELLDRVGPKESKRILSLVENSQLIFQTKPAGGREPKKELILAHDAVIGLAEELLDNHCSGCAGKDECYVCNLLEVLGIPPVTSVDKCIYQTPKFNVDTKRKEI